MSAAGEPPRTTIRRRVRVTECSQHDPLSAFEQFAVTGEMVQRMESARVIWRGTVALSHLAIWCSPPSGGKTAIAQFAAGELAAAGYRVMFFEEDVPAGNLRTMYAQAQECGFELFNSTLTGKSPRDQIEALQDLVRDGGDLRQVVMFFDTLAKYVDLRKVCINRPQP